jgi:hypothetical protein
LSQDNSAGTFANGSSLLFEESGPRLSRSIVY